MKKLIEELRAKYTQLYMIGHGDELLNGFGRALEIVKSHNPWVPISILPPEVNNSGNSLDVVLTDGSKRMISYYRHPHREWAYESFGDCQFFDPTHWTYLPEVKK